MFYKSRFLDPLYIVDLSFKLDRIVEKNMIYFALIETYIYNIIFILANDHV